MRDGTAKPPVTVIYSKDLLTRAQPRSNSGPHPRCVADSWDGHKLERARIDARKARALSASFSFTHGAWPNWFSNPSGEWNEDDYDVPTQRTPGPNP